MLPGRAPRPGSSGGWLGPGERGAPLGGSWSFQKYEGQGSHQALERSAPRALGWHGRRTRIGREETLARSARGPRPREPRGHFHRPPRKGRSLGQAPGAPHWTARSGPRRARRARHPQHGGEPHTVCFPRCFAFCLKASTQEKALESEKFIVSRQKAESLS